MLDVMEPVAVETAATEPVYVGFRLRAYPTPEQEATLVRWSAAAGVLWNELVGWWRPGMRRYNSDRVMIDNGADGNRFAGLRSEAAGKALWNELLAGKQTLSYAVKAWGASKPTWALDCPAVIAHGVIADFDQAVKLWRTSQQNTTAVAAWRKKRADRGLRQLPKWVFAAPSFQPAGERLNLRWQPNTSPDSTPLKPVVGNKRRMLLTVPNLGHMLVHMDDGFPAGRIQSVRLSRDKTGIWWVGLSIKTDAAAYRPPAHGAGSIVGLDRNTASGIPVAASSGQHLRADRVPGERWSGLTTGEEARRLRLQQQAAMIHRSMSPECHRRGAKCSGMCGFGKPVYVRAADGTIVRDTDDRPVIATNVRGQPMAPSKNLLEIRRQIAKLDARAVRRKQHERHTFTARVTDRFDVIGIEDLNTKSMTSAAKGTVETPTAGAAAKAGLNKAILEVGWYEIERQLAYKAERKHRTMIRVPAAYSSLTCSECGHVNTKDARETQARFVCSNCGIVLNADKNAAGVIADRTATAVAAAAPGRTGEVAVETRPKSGRSRVSGRSNKSCENAGMEPSTAASDPITHPTVGTARNTRDQEKQPDDSTGLAVGEP